MKHFEKALEDRKPSLSKAETEKYVAALASVKKNTASAPEYLS
jgi:SpoVK/Ycf46/Vps4 family AAA+-type ATPase